MSSSSLAKALPNYFLDYLDLAITDNHLYITTPLDDLSKSLDARYSLYYEKDANTFSPVQGALDKMYWATHLTNDKMRIYKWDDSKGSKPIKTFDRAIPLWFVLTKGLGKCSVLKSVLSNQLQEGNWCERSDSRITSWWKH